MRWQQWDGEAQHHREIFTDVQRRHNNKSEKNGNSLTTTSLLILPPPYPSLLLSLSLFLSSVIIAQIIIRLTLPCRPHGFGERCLRHHGGRGRGGWAGGVGRREEGDKRPNKVHLNIEAARPFSPCPYKELVVNLDGPSS